MADEPLAADLAGAISEALTGALSDGGSVRGDVLRWAARAGVLAGGAVAGVAVRRYAKRRSAGRADLEASAEDDDPLAGEPFGTLRCPPTPVVADDGVPLWMEVCDPPGGLPQDAPVLVFVPGFCLTLDSWHFQRRDLRDLGRLVFYDQRGHGRSGRGVREHATIEQLARDLRRVLDAADPPVASPRAAQTPDGDGRVRPVVLVGHSLGGMVVLAFAAAYPELFGPRVAGAALLATSPGRLAEVTLGLPAALARVLWPRASGVVGRVATRPALVERGLRADRDVGLWLTKRLSFGPRGVSPALARFTGAMLNSTRLDVFAEFFPEFGRHDKEAALPTFLAVQTVVVAGEHDLMTPADHSRGIAAVLPAAELTLLEDTGHLVPLERPDEVNDILRRLVERVRLDVEVGDEVGAVEVGDVEVGGDEPGPEVEVPCPSP